MIWQNNKKTRKGSKAFLSSPERCLHIIRHPKMKNTNHNYKEIKVIMEYDSIPRSHFSK